MAPEYSFSYAEHSDGKAVSWMFSAEPPDRYPLATALWLVWVTLCAAGFVYLGISRLITEVRFDDTSALYAATGALLVLFVGVAAPFCYLTVFGTEYLLTQVRVTKDGVGLIGYTVHGSFESWVPFDETIEWDHIKQIRAESVYGDGDRHWVVSVSITQSINGFSKFILEFPEATDENERWARAANALRRLQAPHEARCSLECTTPQA